MAGQPAFLLLMEKILIMGVGNILLGDEGFGVHALQYLESNYIWPENVKLLDGGTLGLMLMAELMECDRVIILDIALGGHEPGTFYRLDNEDMQKTFSLGKTAHSSGIEDILISCDLAGHRPKAVIFAMEPFNYNKASAELTSGASLRLPDFCSRVAQQLNEIGIIVEPVFRA